MSSGKGFPPTERHVKDTWSPLRLKGERSPNNCGTDGGSKIKINKKLIEHSNLDFLAMNLLLTIDLELN